MKEASARKLARLAWLGLIAWQFAWLAILPSPHGKENLVFACLMTVPMLLPLPGILKLEARGLIWGAYVGALMTIFGMVELWADPSERPAALLQLVFCGLFFLGLTYGTRKRR